MLEKYYLKPESIDRIRASWISKAIEEYVVWMTEHEYRLSSVKRRVPLLVNFGEYAKSHGACSIDELANHVEDFVAVRTRRWQRHRKSSGDQQILFRREVRGPIEQMLRLAVPEWERRTRAKPRKPFAAEVPYYFNYLEKERGLSSPTMNNYVNHLYHFEKHLQELGLNTIRDLAPSVISSFITTRATKLSPQSMKPLCSALRSFFLYCYRQEIVDRDFSPIVESPQAYRLAHLPRSISWDDLQRTLDSVDRRSVDGRRDYALLLLMATYGLRAREIAKLKIDDIDWRSERFMIPARKAGHCTAYPLSSQVGAAILDYLEHGRPRTTDRRVFQKVVAPPGPMTYAAIASRAGHYLKKAGIEVRRPGSHTLRHTCVQRLVDSDFSLKHIGDYVGHRSSASTEIYAKVDIEKLRMVALETEEGVL